ncbi:hypothetical protein Cgig2_003542 [Carnegiea gigantea]|uniref:phosphoribosylglycinamide formyltransferase 1 n=1 Tax=Carnegiea gigantea TaxID=171969 RepID=A0A9Q1JTV3_9CARY|nr:hypothetical protein Cgig2_003542 [Carnegiea gigantea]
MVAQSLHMRVFPNVSLPLPIDFKGSSFGSLTLEVQTTKWDRTVASPTYCEASCTPRCNGTHFSWAMATHKGEDFIIGSKDSELKPKRKNLAVFVSGRGSNFKAIHQATLNGAVLRDVAVLVTNKRYCGGAVYARENGILVVLFPKSKEEPEGLSADDLVTILSYQTEFIACLILDRKFKVNFKPNPAQLIFY